MTPELKEALSRFQIENNIHANGKTNFETLKKMAELDRSVIYAKDPTALPQFSKAIDATGAIDG